MKRGRRRRERDSDRPCDGDGNLVYGFPMPTVADMPDAVNRPRRNELGEPTMTATAITADRMYSDYMQGIEEQRRLAEAREGESGTHNKALEE